MLFQYSTTLSSSVHRRTTAQTGRLRSGRIAETMSPSLDSPSEAIITHAFLPDARSSCSSPWICVTTSRMCRHRGVCPEGELSRIAMSMANRDSSSTSFMPTRMGWAPFNSRNSLFAFATWASVAWNFNPSVSSCHLVQVTIFSTEPLDMSLCPSVADILPESSHMKKRIGIRARFFKNVSCSPKGHLFAVKNSLAAGSLIAVLKSC
mmetsp:Transcript_3951/g.6216  ORF Transcript_3951/g.6216 Transcript_3951/m.6216 type:complete len:207 (-) Transcript_3951:428-1048(-)